MMLRLGALRSLVVLAPHPDDETIGAFGLMALLRRRGVAVRIVVVSDGRGSHPGSPTWAGERLIRERRCETRRAVSRVGVCAGDVTFLNFPDGHLHTATKPMNAAIAGILRRTPKPALVAGPVADDDHSDHRAVAAAIAGARMAGVRSIGYCVWPAGMRLRHARALPLGAAQRLAKRRAILSYRTQAGGITDDPAGFTMTRKQVAAFSRPFEMFLEHAR